MMMTASAAPTTPPPPAMMTPPPSPPVDTNEPVNDFYNSINNKLFQSTTLTDKTSASAPLLVVDPVVCQKAARYASRVQEEMSKRSTLLAKSPSSSQQVVPGIDRADILPYIGELLGKGGFNSVYELNIPKDFATTSSPSTSTLFTHCKLHNHQLAIKFLSDAAMTSPDEFCNGAADLLMEAQYLTALAAHPHPSLIAIHAVCSQGPQGFLVPGRAGYFIVIDRLVDTLDRRMDVWVELIKRNGFTTHQNNSNKRLRALELQRIMVCVDIASALKHLHQLKLLFRDLKPDNIGFDYSGQVKLFDFGLAKELDPKQKTSNNLYLMSGGTGSRRFMAPEVALSEPYSLSADIYSFSILLWEVLTLKKAFAHMPVDEHREKVVNGNDRPELDASWSEELQALLKKCWKRSPFDRPDAREVYRILKKECQTIYMEEFAPK